MRIQDIWLRSEVWIVTADGEIVRGAVRGIYDLSARDVCVEVRTEDMVTYSRTPEAVYRSASELTANAEQIRGRYRMQNYISKDGKRLISAWEREREILGGE
jgi:hypothetical protein